MKKALYQRWWVWTLISLGALAGGTALTGWQSYKAAKATLPDVEAVRTFARAGSITIKADNGEILQQMGPATREKLAFDEIPPQLVQAFVASEDKNFYQHTGVSLRRSSAASKFSIGEYKLGAGGSPAMVAISDRLRSSTDLPK